MGRITTAMSALGLGALAMYLFDPNKGKTRRTMIRDRAQSNLKSKQRALEVMKQDFRNRSRGMMLNARSRFQKETGASDELISERIRSQLGRCCSHPRAIKVEVENGVACLSGDVLASEVQAVVRMARHCPGVKRLDNTMNVHDRSENFPGLQGEGHQIGGNGRATPAMCLVMLCGGAALTLMGLGRRGVSGAIMGAVGTGLMTKAFHDTEHRCDPNPSRSHKNGGSNSNSDSMDGSSNRVTMDMMREDSETGSESSAQMM